jgi:hypothetical protein
MATLTTDTRELRALADALRRAPEQAAELVQVAAYECSEILASTIRDAAPEFQGDLRSSIEGRVVQAQAGAANVTAEVSAGVPYALVQDVGRRPGKMPPEAPIRRYVRLKISRGQIDLGVEGRRGSVTGRGGRYRTGVGDRRMSAERSLVYLIRRAIGRKGTRPHNYIDRGIRAAEPHLSARIARLEDQLAALLERA